MTLSYRSLAGQTGVMMTLWRLTVNWAPESFPLILVPFYPISGAKLCCRMARRARIVEQSHELEGGRGRAPPDARCRMIFNEATGEGGRQSLIASDIGDLPLLLTPCIWPFDLKTLQGAGRKV